MSLVHGARRLRETPCLLAAREVGGLRSVAPRGLAAREPTHLRGPPHPALWKVLRHLPPAYAEGIAARPAEPGACPLRSPPHETGELRGGRASARGIASRRMRLRHLGRGVRARAR